MSDIRDQIVDVYGSGKKKVNAVTAYGETYLISLKDNKKFPQVGENINDYLCQRIG